LHTETVSQLLNLEVDTPRHTMNTFGWFTSHHCLVALSSQCVVEMHLLSYQRSGPHTTQSFQMCHQKFKLFELLSYQY